MRTRNLFTLGAAAALTLSLAACGGSSDKVSESSENASGEATSSSNTPLSVEKCGADQDFKVGFVMRTLDSPYYVALADAVEELSLEQGWEYSILDSGGDTEKESQNMDAMISEGVDLLFFDAVVPDPAVPAINRAADAGIPVINLDTGVGEGAIDVTTVYSDNKQNGFLVGQAYAEAMGQESIEAILLSGNKGSVAGTERRMGLMAGIIQSRTGVPDDEAWAAAQTMEDELTGGGKSSNKDAKLNILGQGWGDWTEEGGLVAAEDLITANANLNTIFAENDQMLFGAQTALDNAGVSDVTLVAAADGAKRAYDLIKEDGNYFATGENSPYQVANAGVSIAKEILVDCKDPNGYPDITHTDAVAVTKENVEERYEFGF